MKIYLIECLISEDTNFNYEKAFRTAAARDQRMSELIALREAFFDACDNASSEEAAAALDKCYLRHGHIEFEADEVELED